MKPQHSLGNMRELRVHHLIAFRHDDASGMRRASTSRDPDVIEVPEFGKRATCVKKEGSGMPDMATAPGPVKLA
jgi:hypothetical protein